MGLIKHTKRKALFDNECKNTTESQNKFRLTMLQDPSLENIKNHMTPKKQASKVLHRCKRLHKKEIVNEIKANKHNIKQVSETAIKLNKDLSLK